MLPLGRTVRAAVLLVASAVAPGWAAAPPAPTAYFTDQAGVVPADRADSLNARLRAFAEETSTQILVTVFDRLPEGESLEDFTSSAAQAWRVGQKGLDNGAVLFVFAQDRKLRIEVGYGLEGALTDALASRIIREAIVPRFRTGDWAGGLEAGVDAMMAATRGEYKAAPRPARGRAVPLVIVILIVLFLIILSSQASRLGGPQGRTYSRRGTVPWVMTSGDWGRGGSWGGGWGGGGGGSFGGGGGFSGGGGSFGGGGASGDW